MRRYPPRIAAMLPARKEGDAMKKSWNRPALSDEHLLGMLDAFPGSVFAILPDKDVSFPIYDSPFKS